jgi:formate-dependent nitrite reductase cytochrome c552 subunit
VGGTDSAYRTEAVGLACARRGAPYVHADDGSLLAFEENGGAACGPLPVCCVANEHAGYVAKIIQHAGVKSP